MASNTIALRKWKRKWDERYEVWLRKDRGVSWNEILVEFRGRGVVKKHRKSWCNDNQKFLKEVDQLAKAFTLDKLLEFDRLQQVASDLETHINEAILQRDYEGVWRRVAESMPINEKSGKWTAEKVKYAWAHGVSARCEVSPEPVPWSQTVYSYYEQ